MWEKQVGVQGFHCLSMTCQTDEYINHKGHSILRGCTYYFYYYYVKCVTGGDCTKLEFKLLLLLFRRDLLVK